MRILIFGDSIVQGFYDTDLGGWVNRLAVYSMSKVISSDYTYSKDIFNIGISGHNTERLLNRIECELDARTHGENDIIMFSIGVNDSSYEIKTGEKRIPQKVFEKNLKKLIEISNKRTKNILFIGIFPIDDSKLVPSPWNASYGFHSEFAREYNKIIEKVCKENKISFISVENVFENEDLSKYLHDGLHPNSEGHKKIFEYIKKELKKLNII